MRPWHAALVGAGGVALIGSGLLTGFPKAVAQGDSDGEVRAPRDGTMDLLHAGTLQRREEFPPFDLAVRNESDLELGRLNYMLQMSVPPGEDSSNNYYIADADDVMDLHMLTHRAFRASGSIVFIHDFDPGNPDLITHYKSGVVIGDSPSSMTVHFNPPLRIREGDLIFASVTNAEEGVPGGAIFFLHGTVPPSSGGDTLRIE